MCKRVGANWGPETLGIFSKGQKQNRSCKLKDDHLQMGRYGCHQALTVSVPATSEKTEGITGERTRSSIVQGASIPQDDYTELMLCVWWGWGDTTVYRARNRHRPENESPKSLSSLDDCFGKRSIC